MRVSFNTSNGDSDQIQEQPKPRQRIITPQGEDMTDWGWDYCDDPDQEVEEFKPLKTPYEIKKNMHFSLNGITAFMDDLVAFESPANKSNLKNAKLWEKTVEKKG